MQIVKFHTSSKAGELAECHTLCSVWMRSNSRKFQSHRKGHKGEDPMHTFAFPGVHDETESIMKCDRCPEPAIRVAIREAVWRSHSTGSLHTPTGQSTVQLSHRGLDYSARPQTPCQLLSSTPWNRLRSPALLRRPSSCPSPLLRAKELSLRAEVQVRRPTSR